VKAGADGAVRRRVDGFRRQVPSGHIACGCLLTEP